MKTVFVKDGAVVSHALVFAAGVVATTTIEGATAHTVPDDSPVDIGWAVVETDGQLEFTAPAPLLPLLTPMTLYMAFQPAERVAIKASKDPMVTEFWTMYQLSVDLQKPTDPNLVSVRKALEYLAAPVEPGPGAGILAGPERVEQIRAGIPQ
jgi:hypothetical protein